MILALHIFLLAVALVATPIISSPLHDFDHVHTSCGVSNPSEEMRRSISEHLNKALGHPDSHDRRRAASSPYSMVVPVVFNVLHFSNGTGKDLTRADFKNQIRILNEAFKEVTIKFKIDQINYIENDQYTQSCAGWDGETLSVLRSIQEQYTADPTTHLTIFTCSGPGKPHPLGGNFYGRAIQPYDFPTEEDSGHSIMSHFGLIPGTENTFPQFSAGSQIVHMVGHYFGLLHTYSFLCSELYGDEVDDTPLQRFPDIPSCAQGVDTCPNFPGLDSVTNPMHNPSDDSCTEPKFTPGQVERMRAIIAGYRPKLLANTQKKSKPLPTTTTIPATTSTEFHTSTSTEGSSSCAQLGWPVIPGTNICASSRFNGFCTFTTMRYWAARYVCNSQGARLCRETEFSANAVRPHLKFKCQYPEGTLYWTSTLCSLNDGGALAVSQNGTNPTCEEGAMAGDNFGAPEHFVMCCADA